MSEYLNRKQQEQVHLDYTAVTESVEKWMVKEVCCPKVKMYILEKNISE